MAKKVSTAKKVTKKRIKKNGDGERNENKEERS